MDKIKILLDTDMGTDCDDAGALAVLHNFANSGKADISAVVHCSSEISGSVALKAINTWYNRGDIPVGRWDKSVFLEGELSRRYTAAIMEEYLKNHDMPKLEGSVRVMRRALANNVGVTIAVIGMMNNIAELLRSQPDDISPLSGVDLVKKSVKNMYVMGGNFADLTYAEWNIVNDIQNAQYVSESFPVPIIYCGFEIGENVLTGTSLKSVPDGHPVKLAYDKHSGHNGGIRNSWDPITVYCTVEQDTPLYFKSKEQHISFDDEGKVILGGNGKDCYLIANASDEEVRAVIEELLY